jgi:methylenetetrahydrofolate reductase (NADPH)
MKYSDIQNVLALRGDSPKGQRDFIPHKDGHKHASELVNQIRLLNEGKYLTTKEGKYYEGEPLNFGIGVAGYPEGHPECPDKKKDLEYLKIKVDNGADYIITQMFLDVALYLKFVDEAQKIGINVPIIPGIMPIEKYSQVKFVLNQLRITMPRDIERKLDDHKDDGKYIQKMCEEHTLSMARKLIENGVPGIQFFTMNKPEATNRILQELAHW